MNRFRNEIGSEFWSVPISKEENHLFGEDVSWFVSGRSALESIILDIKRKNKVKTVAIPSWCCDSMIKPFIDAEINVVFYSVYLENGKLKRDFSAVKNCDIIFLMDYFGYDSFEKQEIPHAIYIQDVTHSIFAGEREHHYAFGSLRKWAGFYTGGFAFGVERTEIPKNTEYANLRALAMSKKGQYISGVSDSKDYLKDFALAEEMLDNSLYASACESDIEKARHLDINFIKSRRRENAAILLNEFANIAIFKEIKEQDCPLFVPIIVPDNQRDNLRVYLIKNNIYCPVHWPISDYHKLVSRTANLYENSLSLVCDQRYTKEDMLRLTETIKLFWKGSF